MSICVGGVWEVGVGYCREDPGGAVLVREATHRGKYRFVQRGTEHGGFDGLLPRGRRKEVDVEVRDLADVLAVDVDTPVGHGQTGRFERRERAFELGDGGELRVVQLTEPLEQRASARVVASGGLST